MKRIYFVILFCLGAWGIGFFIFHAGPAIHTLVGLAILIRIHAILSAEDPALFGDKLILEIKYYWYIKIFKKDIRVRSRNYSGHGRRNRTNH